MRNQDGDNSDKVTRAAAMARKMTNETVEICKKICALNGSMSDEAHTDHAWW